jgi:hypothetical protein
MRLFKICPDAYNKYSHYTYKPEKGICLSWIKNVPCLTTHGSIWLTEQDTTPNYQILPVILTEESKKQLQIKIDTKKYFTDPFLVKYANLHKSSDGVNYLKEEKLSEDCDALVLLEIPLSAAQPYYEFQGDAEVILGAYGNYYGEWNGDSYKLEQENALRSAIVRMRNGAKIAFTYTNRYGEGKIIENLVGHKFEFICSDGQMLRIDDYNFQKLYSNFKM